MKKIIINPATDAVFGIDVMSTFMPGGGLAVPNGDKVVDPMLELYGLFPENRRYACKELHRRGHISLASSYVGLEIGYKLTFEEVFKWTDNNHKIVEHARFTLNQLKLYLRVVGHQTLWPDHALENTSEADLHPKLKEIVVPNIIIKGQDPTRDSYSAVRDALGKSTGLVSIFRANNTRRIFTGGLAFEYCVGWTDIHLADEGFEVYVVKEATQSVGGPDDREVIMMKEYFEAMGIKAICLDDLKV